MSDRAGLVAAAFREWTGRDPEGVWAAPGRVNLIGEHTDYNDGFVLPAAIDRLVLVAAGRRDGGRLRLWSRQAGPPADLELAAVGPGRVEGWAAYPAGVAWALGRAGVELGGADLVVDGDVPAGSGLSSSAALECATATALADLHGAGLDRPALAALARRAENEVVGVPSGAMDQMVSMLGRAGHALFLDTRSLATEQVPLPLEAAGLCLVVLDTRAGHRLVDGAYADRRAACQAAAAVLGVAALRDATLAQVEQYRTALGEPGLRRARHVVTENARVLEAVALLRAGELDRLGPLLAASHASLRDDYEVSSPELDPAVTAAVEAGAVGARMTGAGFGGSAIALVPAGLAGQVGDWAREAFAAAGFGPPEITAVVPS
ncbi:MAG TPA: galactokinase, partial [Actinomycetota bacterium]|nr:galactokinase [Actinomycetota bacterium]